MNNISETELQKVTKRFTKEYTKYYGNYYYVEDMVQVAVIAYSHGANYNQARLAGRRAEYQYNLRKYQYNDSNKTGRLEFITDSDIINYYIPDPKSYYYEMSWDIRSRRALSVLYILLSIRTRQLAKLLGCNIPWASTRKKQIRVFLQLPKTAGCYAY